VYNKVNPQGCLLIMFQKHYQRIAHHASVHKIKHVARHPAVAVPLATFAALLTLTVLVLVSLNASSQGSRTSHIRTAIVSHDEREETVPTRAATVGELLERLEITLHEGDVVEPGRDARITVDGFRINVYRGAPVTIVDGDKKIFTFSAAATSRSIVKQVGVEVYPEDRLHHIPTDNFLLEGSIGPRVVIDRATPVHMNLYGTAVVMRTHAETVGELLEERNINLGEDDSVQPDRATPITENMQIFLLQKGTQLATIEEEIPMPVEEVRDDSLSIGTRVVRQEGSPGKRLVTYQIQLENGQEAGRTQIQSVVVQEPVKQIVAIGTKPIDGLSESKGVFFFTDSRGITHRETYYDLPMGGVMRLCGGGTYSVRSDGAKVDQDGYILVAANLQNYPRCSVVETSLGPGKVYDTGGFALRHPHGFDLATDWTNNDGR
jgi:uncharacterized protein YabE (DUF348 family)